MWNAVRARLVAVLTFLSVLTTVVLLSAGCSEERSGSTVAVAFLGDSYTVGSGASSAAQRWTSVVSAHFGWTELNFGIGGTGYLNPLHDHASYPYRIPAIAAARPAMVVVSGGYNDLGPATRDPQAGLNAIRKTFDLLRKALPKATLYAVRPFAPAGPPPPALGAFGSAVEQAVRAAGGTYLDVGDPLRYLPQDISADRLHPNDAGYRALAAAFERAYERSGH